MKKSILFLLLILCLAELSTAQKARRRLSYTQLFEEIQKHPDTVYRLENAEIFYNHQTDSLRFGVSDKYYTGYTTKKNSDIAKLSPLKKAEYEAYQKLPVINIDKSVILDNVTFVRNEKYDNGFLKRTFLRKFNFSNEIRFISCKDLPIFEDFEVNEISIKVNVLAKYEHMRYIFNNCVFKTFYLNKNYYIEKDKNKTSSIQFFDFDNCTFKKSIDLNTHYEHYQKSSFTFSNCKFFGTLRISNYNISREFGDLTQNELNFIFKNCHFKAEQEAKKLGLSISSGTINTIDIDSCIVEKLPDSVLAKKSKKVPVWNEIGLKNVVCENLSITNSRFDTHFFIIGTKITEELFLENNQFSGDFSLGSGSSLSGFARNHFNYETAFMPYRQFKKNLSTEISEKGTTVYYGIGNQELSNEVEYEHLLAYYNRFYKMYQDQKDQASANACYVALKSLETRKLAYQYQQKPNVKTYLNWQLNEFLSYFSDFGTDPVKSLEKSLYWILVFAALFVLFPSEKDYLHKSQLIPVLERWGAYLKHEGGFSEIEESKRQEKLAGLKRFKEELMLSYGKIPMVLSIFAKPLYQTALWYYQFNRWFLEKIDFTQGNWAEMSNKRKFWISSNILVAISLLLLWGVVMRLVNALALSLNCFVTLGYGEIQAKGISRYLAVIEGLFGWFMLSIFSVSLIGQLLA